MPRRFEPGLLSFGQGYEIELWSYFKSTASLLADIILFTRIIIITMMMMMMMMMMITIIIIHVFGAINCFLHSTRTGANILGPEVPGEFFYLMDGNLLSSRRMIFCSSLMLPGLGIFPKFWFIPSVISPSAPTKSAQSLPSFPTFSWFQSQDLCILGAFQ